jgi:hypothetical protein
MQDEATRTYRRAEDLECNEVPDGYVIYDNAREDVHFLNLTAAAVFELCDGENDAASIAAIVQDAFGLPAPPNGDVEACLASLHSQGLIAPVSSE